MTAKAVAFLVLALVALADALTTHRILQRGGREMNPFLAKLLGARPKLWFALAWRALAIVGLWFLFPDGRGAWLLVPLILGVAYWNYRKGRR